jgi:hypothetical protein
VKGKWQARKRRGLVPPADGAVVEAPPRRPRESRAAVRMPAILQASRQKLKSMSLSEAARAISASGDGLVVYRDTETAVVSVLYKRADGELTLIETDV